MVYILKPAFPFKKEFRLECPERSFGILLACIPCSTVVEVESRNPGPLAVKGEGRRGSLSPVTEQDDAGFLNMVLGTLDVHMPERLTYPSKQADWRWRESRK